MTITLPPFAHREMLKTIAVMMKQVGFRRGVYLVYPSPSAEARRLLEGESLVWIDYSRVKPVNPEQMEVQFLTRSRFQTVMESTGQEADGEDVLKLIDAMDPQHEVLVAIAASRILLWSREQIDEQARRIREVEDEILNKRRMPADGVDATPEHVEQRSDDHLMVERTDWMPI